MTRSTRFSRPVTSSRRWPALRLAALRRDGFLCVACGARGVLQVDHIEPVRSNPQRAFDLENLQSLCGRCHAAKTRSDCGWPQPSAERVRWRHAVAALSKKSR